MFQLTDVYCKLIKQRKRKQKRKKNKTKQSNSQIVCLRIFAFALNVDFSEPFSRTFTSCSSEKFIKYWFIANAPFKRSQVRK